MNVKSLEDVLNIVLDGCNDDSLPPAMRDGQLRRAQLMDADLRRRFGKEELEAFAGRLMILVSEYPSVARWKDYRDVSLILLGVLVGYECGVDLPSAQDELIAPLRGWFLRHFERTETC